MPFLFRRNKRREAAIPASPPSDIDYRAVALTDVGSVRDNNEDHLVFIRPFDKQVRRSHGCLALVADGMGGHQNGEVASQMAVDLISRNYFDAKTPGVDALKRAFEKANRAIYDFAQRSKTGKKSMGTTCTAVALIRQRIFLAHVGDSRAYLLKGEKLIQLSNDHTYVQHLLDVGKITYQESLSHPQRNIVTQAMGTNPKLKGDFMEMKTSFEEGDKLLVCSDGLYEYFKDEELATILSSYELHKAAQSLIELAKKRGGHDNISVLLAETFASQPGSSLKETQKTVLS